MLPSFSEGATTLSQAATRVVSSASTVGQGISKAVDGASSILQNAQQGLTNVATNVQNAVAGVTSSVSNAVSSAFSGLQNSSFSSNKDIVPYTGGLPAPNVLHNYASYNYIITMSVLSDQQYNFPDDSYRKGNIGKIIFRSGSGDPNNRVQTAFGKFDFYPDNLRIDSAIGFDATTGNTNSTSISFNVYEPYSMGLFFQSIQTAALEQGHKNYIDAPYLLTIEFIGHLSADVQGVPADNLRKNVEKTTKYIPLKIRNIEMNVSNKGAEYLVEAYPYNHSAYSTTYVQMKQDVLIEGKTIHEVLQTGTKSLQKVLNDYYKKAAEATNTDPDQVLIYFPKDLATGKNTSSSESSQGATSSQSNAGTSSVQEKLKISVEQNSTLVQNVADINEIGQESMGFDAFDGAIPGFPDDNFAYDSEKKIYSRDKLTVDPTKKALTFAQGGDAIEIINQVILTSNYAKKALSDSQVAGSGKIKWWRISSQVYNLPSDKNEKIKGIKPKLIVYRIIPYTINASVLTAINTPSSSSKTESRTVVKEYNYIYTSKNLDILDLNLTFNAGFYTSLHSGAGKNSQAVQTQRDTGPLANPQVSQPAAPPPGSEPNKSNPPGQMQNDRKGSSAFNKGGAENESPASIAARQAHDVFLTNTDMVQVNLTILGDPYYLGDSGMGNYSAKSTDNENINADNSINYENGVVYIKVNFRTPIDIDDATGTYDFGKTKLLADFSGLYRVTMCESTFSGGKFTQKLDIFRQPNQLPEADTSTPPVQSRLSTSSATEVAKKYSTSPGSQQTQMLADQEAGMFD